MQDRSVHDSPLDSETLFQSHQSLLASLERYSVYSDEISSFLPVCRGFFNTLWSFKPVLRGYKRFFRGVELEEAGGRGSCSCG